MTYTPPEHAVKLMDSIKDAAIARGWQEDQLSGTGGGGVFVTRGAGLVCFLHEGDEITGISYRAIRISRKDGTVLRFYNWLVRQPWEKTVPVSDIGHEKTLDSIEPKH